MKKLTLSTALFAIGFGGIAQTTMDTYFATNSLVNHLVQVNITPSQETSVPHWLYFLAREAEHSFSVNGNFMSLINANDSNYIPLENNWYFDFDSVPSTWDSYNNPSLGQSPIDNIVITPYNFVQSFQTSPIQNYVFGDTSLSPITAIDSFVQHIRSQSTSMPIYIYEGWNDMSLFLSSGFPPNQTEYTNWINSNRFGSTYHNWYLELHDSATSFYPNDCVKMIPVGPILGELLNMVPYRNMMVDSIFEDDAPHGRPTIYFLAAMITYMALFEEMPPATYQPPAQWIDPIIITNYQNIITEIWNQLQGFRHIDGTSRVFCTQNTTHVKENINNPQFDVYPNPSNTIFQILSHKAYERISIRNITGSIIKETNNNNFIDIQDLSKGIYLLELFDNQNKTLGMQKVVVK